MIRWLVGASERSIQRIFWLVFDSGKKAQAVIVFNYCHLKDVLWHYTFIPEMKYEHQQNQQE